jgi:molybdenum-dependent DNA-binding transcriptional regulator ModE
MNDRLEPRIRILLGSSIAIGPGKATLLEAIGETGSVHFAILPVVIGEDTPRL